MAEMIDVVSVRTEGYSGIIYRLACGGSPMILRTTTKFKYPNGQDRKFYGCSQFPACRGVHGAHPDGSPMGIAGDKATRQARVEAHSVFDAAWRARGMTKKEAYRWLQDITGLSDKGAHISRFTVEQCADLVARIALLETMREMAAEVTA